MIRCLLLLLLLIIGPAQAQTPSLIPIPQTVPIPLVPNGLDASGNFTSRQISSNEILTPLPYSTSSNTAVLGFGQMTISLDNPNGFIVGQVVQVTAPDGQFLIGALVALDLSTFNATINAIVPNQGAGVYTSFQVQVVGGSNINGVPVWAGLSIDGVDSITYPTAAGATMTLNVEPGKAFSNFSTVYVWAPQDITTYAIGTVITYNPTTGAMRIFVKQASPTGLTYSTNYVSMIDTSAIDAALTNYSSTPYNGAASGNVSTPSTLKMTVSLPGSLVGGGSSSAPSQTLVAGSVFPFTVVAGQYFPIQGNVLLDDLTPGVANHYIGSVYSYQGTTLQLLIQSVFGTGSPSQAWGMYLIAGPPQVSAILYQMTGLLVTGSAFGFTVQPGSVQDTTGTVTLTLNAAETAALTGKKVSGTATMTAGVANGSSTAYTTDFSAAGTLTDLNNQLANLNLPAVSAGVIYATDATNIAAPVISVASNTALTINVGNTTGASGNVYRGASPSTVITGFPQVWAIIIARQDSTGNCHTFQVSFTPSGVPDLPSGYTFYRVIAYSSMGGPGSIVNITQPLLASRAPQTPKAVFSATITPTAVGITVASVSTVTGLITLNIGPLGGVPVVTGDSVVLTGAVPTGLTTGTAYYINVQTPGAVANAATFFLYTDLADAYAGGVTGRVIPSGTTAGWSFRYLAYTNVFSAGFDANAPVGGTPGTTTMQFDYNITNALATTAGLASTNLYNLVETGGTAGVPWLVTPNYTFTSTTLVKAPSTIMRNTADNNGPGTWAQQGTNAFNISVWIWGALDEPIPANDNDLLERAVA